MTKLVIPQEKAEQLISDSIKRKHKDADDFQFDRIGSNLIDGNAYYVEFKSKELDKGDAFYYAYIDKDGCRLLDDGEAVIEHFQILLDKRRNILQRLSDFDFLDIVGALLALLIVGAFVFLIVTAKDPATAVSKEFLAIVSLVIGYYFGRNRSS